METRFRIIYQDPDDLEAGVRIVCPSPNWMRKAMSGGLPPIWVYWKLQDEWDAAVRDGRAHSFRHSQWLLNLQWTAKRLPPLTERQAIEYLCMKDLPRSCWAKRSNRSMFKIVDMDEIPLDRTFRDAWEMKDV